MTAQPITQARLKALLHYDPDTGIFRWRTSGTGRKAVAGHVNKPRGYMQIRVDGKAHYLHRLAWLYTHGVWPSDQIDHINRDRADNRIANLREATQAQNQQNRLTKTSTGTVGVIWHARDARWQANIRVGGKKRHLGYFKNLDAAVSARKAAEAAYHTHRPV